MLNYYVIFCISFASMYHIRYTIPVIELFKYLCGTLELDRKKVNLVVFSIIHFIFVCIAAPLILFSISVNTREQIIQDSVKTMMKKYYEKI